MMRFDLNHDIIYRKSPWRPAGQDYHPMMEYQPTADADTPSGLQGMPRGCGATKGLDCHSFFYSCKIKIRFLNEDMKTWPHDVRKCRASLLSWSSKQKISYNVIFTVTA